MTCARIFRTMLKQKSRISPGALAEVEAAYKEYSDAVFSSELAFDTQDCQLNFL